MAYLHRHAKANLHHVCECADFACASAETMVQIYTMWTANQIYELLDERRKSLGLSQADVGMRAFDRPDSTAMQNLRKGAMPGFDRVEALASALDLEIYLGPRREPIRDLRSDDGSYAHIPLHEASLAAGGGFENGESVVIDYLTFRCDWLRRVRVSPDAAVLARIRGDSMQPTISDGDVVMIDTRRRDVERHAAHGRLPRGHVYALRGDDGARVKRLAMIGDLMMVMSDNPEHQTEIYDRRSWRDNAIIGRVVWWATQRRSNHGELC
jgi:phage repressor protein C with HTH and peptisase S24 domain